MVEKKIHHSKRGDMGKKTILIVEDDGILGLQLKSSSTCPRTSPGLIFRITPIY